MKHQWRSDWLVPDDLAALVAFMRQLVLDGCEFDYRRTGDCACRVGVVSQPVEEAGRKV